MGVFKVDPTKHDMSLEFGNGKGKTVPCSFCSQSVRWVNYGSHVEKYHRGGIMYRKVVVAKRLDTVVFAEWQASEANEDGL